MVPLGLSVVLRWGCVMGELVIGISTLAAGIVAGGVVVFYLLRWMPGVEHWGS